MANCIRKWSYNEHNQDCNNVFVNRENEENVPTKWHSIQRDRDVKILGHDKSFAFEFVLSDTEMDKIQQNKWIALLTNQRMTEHIQTLITLHYS